MLTRPFLLASLQCIETLNCPCLTDEQMRELFTIFNDQFEKHFEKSKERDEKRRDEDYDEVGGVGGRTGWSFGVWFSGSCAPTE